MRPALRTHMIRVAMMALGIVISLTFAASASAMQLYGGLYSTDLSSSAPVDLTPVSGVSLSYPDAPVALGWRPVAGAEKYQLQIARQQNADARCSEAASFQPDNVIVSATTEQAGWVPSLVDVENGSRLWTGTYCWRVRVDGTLPGAWSDAHRFERVWNSVPVGLRFYNDHDGSIPRSSSAPDFATGSAVTRNGGYLSWNRVPGAASYEVEVGTSQSFSPTSIMSSRDGVTDSRVNLLHLPDDTYFWRVRAVAPNGTEGPWSAETSSFTVRWLDSEWSSPSKTWPADSSTQSEMRIGWTPMPGASYYEYQVSTDAGCFWNPQYPQIAPEPYGKWVTYPAKYSETDPPYLMWTADPQLNQCRLSDVSATTMNNWVTIQDAIGQEAWSHISQPCVDTQGKVTCEPAGLPDSTPDDWGSRYHGASETNGGADDGRYGNAYQIYWRVRPVYRASQENETGWEIDDEDFVVYGSWSRYTEGGANRQHRFSLDPASRQDQTAGTRCESQRNPGGGCLVHAGSTMRADQAPTAVDGRSMQFPVLTWKPFSGASGYIVEIARDPLFNNMAHVAQVPAPYQQSYAYSKSLPDNSEDTGYWWRVVPCLASSPAPGEPVGACMPLYSSASAGLPLSYGLGGYSDMGVAQTFTKQTATQTHVTANFEGSTPLIRWTRAGVSESDHAAWARGIEGAEAYHVQLARDPFFREQKIELRTTLPRIVPFKPGEGAGKTQQLPDGLWYYRIRGVDRNGLIGSWSAVSSFNKRIAAPTVTGSRAGSIAGSGVTVEWTPVAGATSYTVEWSTDPSFESGTTSAVTLQAAHRIPNTTPGTYYWRVRSHVGEIAGLWSSAKGPVTVLSPSRITYGVSHKVRTVRGLSIIEGQLVVAGTPRNNQRVLLQRKTSSCAGGGAYRTLSSAISGRNLDDGFVRFRTRVMQSNCYRLAWKYASGTMFSAPFEIGARPVVSFRPQQRSVTRGRPFCSSIVSGSAITGRMRVQYKVGKRWYTARTANVRGMKRRRQCAAINRGGVFPVRIVLDRMVHPTKKWKRYETTVKHGGRIRTNDSFQIIR